MKTQTSSSPTLLYILLLILLTTLLQAHYIPEDKEETDLYKPENKEESYKPGQCCDDGPAKMYSYHIHVLFWVHNKDRVESALSLRSRILEKFGLVGDEYKCEIARGDPAPGHPMCWYEIEMAARHPFTTGEFSVFVPYKEIQHVSEWILQRRGDHDVFIHPNTGCELHDHMRWSTWSGNAWPLDPTPFVCHYPGCQPRDIDHDHIEFCRPSNSTSDL